MAINFPNSPQQNDTHVVGDTTWTWNGTSWTSTGTAYTLPVATNTVLGGVKQGTNITIDVDGVISATATGDVTKAASSTDNAIVRFDGTSGDTLQNSNITVDDNGNLVTAGQLWYSNVFADFNTLDTTVDASTYHGMFAHAHTEGHAYFAHAGDWKQILDTDTLLNDLFDTNINTVQTGQFLKWSGTQWINDDFSTSGTLSFSSLETSGTGTITLDSASTLTLTAPDGITANGVPLPSYGGKITLGTSPTWAGSTDISVSTTTTVGTPTGEYTFTFTNAYTNTTDYIVSVTHNEWISSPDVAFNVVKSAGSFEITFVRISTGDPVDQGEVIVLVYEF